MQTIQRLSQISFNQYGSRLSALKTSSFNKAPATSMRRLMPAMLTQNSHFVVLGNMQIASMSSLSASSNKSRSSNKDELKASKKKSLEMAARIKVAHDLIKRVQRKE